MTNQDSARIFVLSKTKQAKKMNTQENTILANILKNNSFEYEKRASFETLEQCAFVVGSDWMNSGWHTPEPVKIKGVDGVMFLLKDGRLAWNHKAIQTETGFDLLEITTKDTYTFEEKYRECQA